MPDETKIASALTAEEWTHAYVGNRWGRRIELYARIGARDVSADQPDQAAQIMALANAALPDDDPRKITREDVALVDKAGRGADSYTTEEWERWPLLAAKLAALLPPNAETR